MAVTFQRAPQNSTPVHNPMSFSATSSNSSQEQFSLIVDLTKINADETETDLVTLKVPVNPIGTITFDIQRHLQGYTGNIFYRVDLSEQYKVYLPFTEVANASGASYLVTQSNPLFEIGDIIEVETDDVASYNTTATITNIVENFPDWYVYTTLPFNGTASGTYSLANNQLTTFPIGASFSGNAFDSAFTQIEYHRRQQEISFEDFYIDEQTDETKYFRTNAPNGWAINRTDLISLGFSADWDYWDPISNPLYYKLTPDSGISPTHILLSRDLIQTGLIEFTLDVFWFFNDATQVVVQIVDSEGDDRITPFTISLRESCSKYEQVTLYFKDSMGAYSPFTFDLVHRENLEIERTTYTKLKEPHYFNKIADFTDRGKTTIDTKVTESWVLNSNWVTQVTSDYLMELYTSPEVFIRQYSGNASIGLVNIPVTIRDTSIERKKSINDLLINHTISLEFSNKNPMI